MLCIIKLGKNRLNIKIFIGFKVCCKLNYRNYVFNVVILVGSWYVLWNELIVMSLKFSLMCCCFDLVCFGVGVVLLNLIVGVVLVYDDCIIGEGYYVKDGGLYVEVMVVVSVKFVDEYLI